jgi:hypothetical protein
MKVKIEIKDEQLRKDLMSKIIEGARLIEENGQSLTFAISGGNKKSLTDALDAQFRDKYSVLSV